MNEPLPRILDLSQRCECTLKTCSSTSETGAGFAADARLCPSAVSRSTSRRVTAGGSAGGGGVATLNRSSSCAMTASGPASHSTHVTCVQAGKFWSACSIGAPQQVQLRWSDMTVSSTLHVAISSGQAARSADVTSIARGLNHMRSVPSEAANAICRSSRCIVSQWAAAGAPCAAAAAALPYCSSDAWRTQAAGAVTRAADSPLNSDADA